MLPQKAGAAWVPSRALIAHQPGAVCNYWKQRCNIFTSKCLSQQRHMYYTMQQDDEEKCTVNYMLQSRIARVFYSENSRHHSTFPLAAGWSDSSSTGSQSGSESDTGSDTDSSSRGGARDTACAVRLAALSCLQQLAKADGKALHPFWIMLLPVYNPLQTKYHDATLMDAVVRDPVPKVTVL